MKKVLLILFCLFLGFLGKAQNLNFFADTVYYYPQLHGKNFTTKVLKVDIVLSPDSVATLYGIADKPLKIKVTSVIREGVTENGTFIAKSFSAKNMVEPYEDVVFTLFYNIDGRTLNSIRISDGQSLVILLINHRQIDEI